MIRVDYQGVYRYLALTDLITALGEAFQATIETPERLHYGVGGAGQTLLVMPAWRPGGDVGVKVATVFPDSPAVGFPAISGEYLLFSGKTGGLRATIDGRALTLLRTAAVSALAADRLAPRRPETLLVVGTGPLAAELVYAHCTVRRYTAVLIWGRNRAKAAGVVDILERGGVGARHAQDLEAAVKRADVIVCATASEQPLIAGSWLKPTAHLSLMGGYKPNMREADDDCLRGARIVVDTQEATQVSGDLLGPLARGVVQARDICLLRHVLRVDLSLETEGLSVFKSVGSALADFAAAELVIAGAERAELAPGAATPAYAER